ncbi:MAG: hypothetical protein MK132_09025 [Lentisphaerales bacterium]|nr:hypothetical protein [Lentisphaerales bacterium]
MKTKICKYCDGEISAKAKICRFCKAKQGTGAGILVYPLVIALAAGAGYYGFKEYSKLQATKRAEIVAKAEAAKKLEVQEKQVEDKFANEPVREPAGVYVKPDLKELPSKPAITKPVKPSKEDFIQEKLNDPEFCSAFKVPLNKKALLKLTNGSSFKCTVLDVESGKVTIQLKDSNAKMSFSVNDIAPSQRKFIFKSVYQTIEATKLFEHEVLKYEEGLQLYRDSMEQWRMECEIINKENEALQNKASL